MKYFTDSGPVQGPFLYRDVPGAIDVLKAPDQPAPVGMARCVGQDTAGVALWHLSIGGADIPQRFVIIDREFRPADPG